MSPFQELSSQDEQMVFKNRELDKRKTEKQVIESTKQPETSDSKEPNNATMRTGEGFWISVTGSPEVVKLNARLQDGRVFSVTLTEMP